MTFTKERGGKRGEKEVGLSTGGTRWGKASRSRPPPTPPMLIFWGKKRKKRGRGEERE